MSVLHLPAAVAERIVEHARHEYPLEACGLIGGLGDAAIVAIPGRNVSPTPATRFLLDIDTLGRQIALVDAGLALVAIYHSHPDGSPTPSAEDIAAHAYPDAVMLICGLILDGQASLRGYCIVQGQVHETDLRIGQD